MSEDQTVKVFATKWALSKGILIVEGNEQPDGAFSWRSESGLHQWLKAGEWSADPVQAIEQAEKRRSKKLASLARDINKYQAKKFIVDTRQL